jgi:hypothetical protein
MTEKDFTKAIINSLPNFKVIPFETTGRAVPDLHIVPTITERNLPPFWCEAKLFRGTIKRGTNPVGFQKGQTQWLTEYARIGRSNIAILCKETLNIFIYEGRDAKLIERMPFCSTRGSLSSANPIFTGNKKQAAVWDNLSEALYEWLAS